jgi:hypothetical protein
VADRDARRGRRRAPPTGNTLSLNV